MQRTVIVASVLSFLAISLGCMCLSFGERTEVIAPDGPYTRQTGSLTVAPGQELAVYYPSPYPSPPNLVVDDRSHQCQIIEQRPDCFRVKNVSSTPQELTWTSRGLRGTPPAVEVSMPPTTH
jgi:hypothetical protein